MTKQDFMCNVQNYKESSKMKMNDNCNELVDVAVVKVTIE